MTHYCSPRFVSLSLLLGLAGSLAGCIDSKSIGLETADDGSGSAESGSEGEGSEGTGGTSQGQTSAPTGGSETDPTAESGEALCPPIDIPACVTCNCIEGEWDCDDSACLYDCEGQACGASCVFCPDEQPDCDPMGNEGLCTADGMCVGTPPPKLGFCEGALQPGFEDELEIVAGCSDIMVFARDAADERGLVLHVDQGLYAQAQAMDMPVHAELDAIDAAVVLEGRAGFNVTIAECSDVIVTDPDIKETWTPQSGTVIIDIVPVDEFSANATVQLVDVELHRVQPGPTSIVVNVTWTDVMVGPVPG